MQQLEFAELDDDGRLVVVADDGTRFAVPVDDRLRAALRTRPALRGGGESPSVSPREVQAMIRAGQTADEVAAATGWDADRVRRFEGPVVAEREHVVGLAKAAHVRAQGRTDGMHTLEARVRERLEGRGVPLPEIGWDAARTDSHGPWTVMVVFSAGGRERRAAWHYTVQDRSIEALDDEARWLSEDEQALPGGLAGHPLLGGSNSEGETADLMATMRERRQAHGRRNRREPPARDRAPDRPAGPAHEDEVLPLENLPEPQHLPEPAHDDLPPAAHPRGSATESPSPVDPDGFEDEVGDELQDVHEHGDVDDRPTPARTKRVAGREGAARRERRRLRLPKLPPAVGEPPVEDEGTQPEGAFARTVDPQEVSFDEFFGPDDDPLDVPEEVPDDALDDPLDVPVDVPDAMPDEMADDIDVGQDEPVDPAEQVEAAAADDAAADDVATEGAADDDAATDDAAEEGDDSEPGTAHSRRKARTSVPSWDDIMFGGSDRRRR